MSKQAALKKGLHSRTTHVVLTAMAAFLLRVALDFTYVNYVDKFFRESLSAGVFAFTGIGTPRLLESYVIAFILSICVAASLYLRPRPSGIILLLYCVVVILPLSSLYGLTDVPRTFFYAAAGSFAVLMAITELIPRVSLPRPNLFIVYLGLTVVFGICVYVYGWLVLTGGLGRLNFDLLSVYEVRAEYIQRLAPFLSYFVPWQANVINILILCYGLYKRNLWMLGISGVAQILLFGMTGHKSFLLSPMLVIGVYFIWQRKNILFYFFSGAFVLVVASYVLFSFTNNHLLPSLLIRRLFFVPAANHLIYYDFFSRPENSFVMLSNSVLAPFIQYPYDAPVPIILARTYWGIDFWPNVGYLGDAFAQFGFVGMFLFSMILGVFLRIVDSVGARLPTSLVAAMLTPHAMALTNSALFTSLLTHGLIFAFLMLWLLRVVAKQVSGQEC
jgi:hypothetical protein